MFIYIEPVKISFAKVNAGIYSVVDKIEFIVVDFFKLAPTLKSHVVFMSPSWDGFYYSSI